MLGAPGHYHSLCGECPIFAILPTTIDEPQTKARKLNPWQEAEAVCYSPTASAAHLPSHASFTSATTAFNATSTLVAVARVTSSTWPVAAFLAHVDAVRNPHQIRILEFDARALVPVIEQHVEPRCFKLRSQRFAGLASAASSPMLVTVTTTVKGAIEAGSQNPFLSFDLLDGRRQNALDADAVAAHDRRYFLAVHIQHPRAHALGVLVAQLEDVADLDRLADNQLARTTNLSDSPSPSFTLRMSAIERPGEIAARHTLRRW
jgi:hypothetical protein